MTRAGERTAKTCLLLAGTPHLARLNIILDRALAADAGEYRAWDQLAKAMAEYRAGRFDECIRAAGEAAAGLREHDDAGKAAADLFAAMAHQQLGQLDQARSMVNEVARYVEQEVPKFNTEDAGPDYTVENWLVLHVALREANGGPAAGGGAGRGTLTGF